MTAMLLPRLKLALFMLLIDLAAVPGHRDRDLASGALGHVGYPPKATSKYWRQSFSWLRIHKSAAFRTG